MTDDQNTSVAAAADFVPEETGLARVLLPKTSRRLRRRRQPSAASATASNKPQPRCVSDGRRPSRRRDAEQHRGTSLQVSSTNESTATPDADERQTGAENRPAITSKSAAHRARVTNGSKILPTVSGNSVWARLLRDTRDAMVAHLGVREKGVPAPAAAAVLAGLPDTFAQRRDGSLELVRCVETAPPISPADPAEILAETTPALSGSAA
jgi:hypothetical protein